MKPLPVINYQFSPPIFFASLRRDYHGMAWRILSGNRVFLHINRAYLDLFGSIYRLRRDVIDDRTAQGNRRQLPVAALVPVFEAQAVRALFPKRRFERKIRQTAIAQFRREIFRRAAVRIRFDDAQILADCLRVARRVIRSTKNK